VTVSLFDLGFIRFKEAWDVQRHIHAERVAGIVGDALLFCEHAPVITMGKSGRKHNLLVSQEELRRRNVEYYDIERGGDLTYHGPGQLVCYPIFKLARLREVQGFVRKMEMSIIKAMNAFGVKGEQRQAHAGVFVGSAKIASIGAAVQGGVTFHGFALDVITDLSYFQLINPCGMPDVQVTSLSREAGREVRLGEVKPPMRAALEEVFEIKLSPTAAQAIGTL
jgi:lipoate-protein ligase B